MTYQEEKMKILAPFHSHNCHSQQAWRKGQTEPYPCDCDIQEASHAIDELVKKTVIGEFNATFVNDTGISDAHRGQILIAISDLEETLKYRTKLYRGSHDWFVKKVLEELPQALIDKGAYELQASQRQVIEEGKQ